MTKNDSISYKEFRFADYFVLVPVNLVFVLSFVSLLSWFFGQAISSDEVTMLFKHNTSLSFLLCSVATYCLWLKPQKQSLFYAGKVLASTILAIGLLALYQQISVFGPSGDRPLIIDFSGVGSDLSGHMSLQSAFIFSLLGLSLFLNSYNRYLNKISTFLNAIVFFISLISLIGYIFQADSLYQVENALRLTENTAISGFLISFAGLFIYPQNKYISMLQSEGAAGSFARRISLASLVLPVLFGRLGVFFYYSGVDTTTTYASVAISSFVTLIMITWKSATAFELVNRDRIGSEQEKLKSTAQIESLLSSSPFGLAFFSAEGELIRANQIFRKYLRIDLDETNIHRLSNFRKLIHFGSDLSFTDFIKTTGHGKSFELKLDIDGTDHFISLNLFPVETKSQEFLGLGISFLDITDLKRIESELIAARDIAEVSSRSKSFFLANMSHEIRTPIGIIMGFVDILNSTTLSEEEKKHNMAIIKRNCRQLLNIIDDILDISKVEAGQIKIRKEFIQTVELLQDLKSILKLKAENKNIEIVVNASSKLPSNFFSDSTRLRQIILNICGNAIKFTKEGKVSIECYFKENKIYFRITDTGLGIESDQLNKLFKPFSQVDSSDTREFGGTGLGLALSQKLARALGGDLILEKTVIRKGSTFLISVDTGQIEEKDLIVSNLEDNEPQKKPIEFTQVPESLKNKSILLVDDSPDNRLLISFMLKKMGLAVETAVDGRDALQKVFDQEFDLILMDLQMPNMGGYEAVLQLRKSGYAKPVIALTAHAMKDEKDKCLANGFSAYLTKPIDKELLISTLATTPV